MSLTTELIPADQPGSKHLMIVLHGLGDSMEGYRWLPGVMNLPWLSYLLVNAPDEYYGGFAWFPYPGERVAAIEHSRHLLVKLLDEQRAGGFASENTFLFGFSQGCLMSVETGVRYPHRLAGVVGVSGWVDGAGELLRERSQVADSQPILITHGRFDPVVPFEPAKRCFESLRRGGLKIEWHEFPKEHTIFGEPEMQVIREFVVRAAGSPG
jgi:phospholipase/carboxylesterase